MVNPLDLSGRTVLVTGASSGIGRETAVLLSQLGSRVVAVGRDEARLAEVLASLEGTGQHLIEAFELKNVDQIPAWIKSIVAKTGPLDGVVHCAGIHSHRPLKILDTTKFEEVLRINSTAAMMLSKGFRQKGCCATGGSSIVLLSSVTGLVGRAGISAYGSSKAAVVGLTKCLALELAPEGIRVNCVAPAMVETEMAEQLFRSLTPEQLAVLKQDHPLGFGKPRDVANSIAFLLSDAARWITGSVLVVDGGYTAR